MTLEDFYRELSRDDVSFFIFLSEELQKCDFYSYGVNVERVLDSFLAPFTTVLYYINITAADVYGRPYFQYFMLTFISNIIKCQICVLSCEEHDLLLTAVMTVSDNTHQGETLIRFTLWARC